MTLNPELLKALRLALFSDLDKAMLRMMAAHEELKRMAEQERAERVRQHLAKLSEDNGGGNA